MQVGPRSGGTGIGLSISKCLVGLMNGEIGFANRHNIGSTFTFTAVFGNGCSNADENKEKLITRRTNLVSADFQSMTALIIDPRQVRVKVTRYHIQRLGINVEVAPNLDQGSVIVSSGKPSIDMVFIEQEIWNKNFKDADVFVNRLRTVKNGRRPSKLFLLTNSISCGRANSANCGADSPCVIMKPLRASMLAASLQHVMGVGNKGNSPNGELSTLPLQNLRRGRKILIVRR